MNRQVVLATASYGIPQAHNFQIVEQAVPELASDEILVQNYFLSVEPAMRGWLSDKGNYSKPIRIGDVMRSIAVGRVAASRCDQYPVGTIVTGWFGWQEMAVVAPTDVIRVVKEVDLPISLSLGVLGLNGMAAYLGLSLVGMPVAGDTVVVSTAAGGVGSIVGQVAKLLGCRTVGITGSEVKVRACRDLYKYDEAFDYSLPALAHRVAEACPNGVNVYFDNTAGAISDAVRANLAIGARIVVCGTASVSSWDPPPASSRVERDLLTKRARMQGFLAFDHRERYESTVEKLAAWVREGKLVWQEDVLEGLEACPDAIAGLYRGENLGKRVIRLR